MPPDTYAYTKHGELVPDAYVNLVVAFLMRAGGRVTLTYAELEASNKRQFCYQLTPDGLELSLVTDQGQVSA